MNTGDFDIDRWVSLIVDELLAAGWQPGMPVSLRMVEEAGGNAVFEFDWVSDGATDEADKPC